MRSLTTVWIALLTAGGVSADEKPGALTFAKNDLGKVPAGWKTEQTGTGDGSVWKVVADDTAPSKAGYVLAQTAQSPGPMFNLCVADKPSLRDLQVVVSFKAVRGEKDQGGGIFWRYQDANNYYVARMNPLEDNYRLYHVVAGKRTQIAGREGIKVPAGEWHTLKVEMTGDRIECYLDGKKEIEFKDSTIQKAGRVGLWTKADAQTNFDNFRVRGLK
ncbi:MAG TPA: family 16 glycoside hydrolase [Gemmataceae bacterium]|nr:family 16 glycoside hydrolase [Gemmataceae bacterium]